MAMTYYQALKIAVELCEQGERKDVADVLRTLPQWQIAENSARIRSILKSFDIDLDAVMAEVKAANESGDHAAMAAATAKLGMIEKIIAKKAN